MPAKRGDRVTPPPKPGNWDVRHATSEAAKGWDALCQVAQANMWEAWVVLSERPTTPANLARQCRLKHALGRRLVNGRTLDQWQYEVTASGRIWYCPDPDTRIVWITLASAAHPKATE